MLNSITVLIGKSPVALIANLVDFERQYSSYDAASNLAQYAEFKPDIVIVALGENVPSLGTEESKAAFKGKFVQLLSELRKNGAPEIVVRSCFWPERTRDDIMKQASEETGCVFVDIGALGRDESNFARSERKFQHGGVATHPGDKGMKAIADVIMNAVMNQR